MTRQRYMNRMAIGSTTPFRSQERKRMPRQNNNPRMRRRRDRREEDFILIHLLMLTDVKDNGIEGVKSGLLVGGGGRAAPVAGCFKKPGQLIDGRLRDAPGQEET